MLVESLDWTLDAPALNREWTPELLAKAGGLGVILSDFLQCQLIEAGRLGIQGNEERRWKEAQGGSTGRKSRAGCLKSVGTDSVLSMRWEYLELACGSALFFHWLTPAEQIIKHVAANGEPTAARLLLLIQGKLLLFGPFKPNIYQSGFRKHQRP